MAGRSVLKRYGNLDKIVFNTLAVAGTDSIYIFDIAQWIEKAYRNGKRIVTVGVATQQG